MNTHGYRLVANSNTAAPDFIPSLVGIEKDQHSPAGTDTYFERVEIGEIHITAISHSRWVSYDNLPNSFRDPILGVKSSRGTFYIPFTELRDVASEQADRDILQMLRAIAPAELLATVR